MTVFYLSEEEHVTFKRKLKTRACIKVAISWVISFLLYSPAIILMDLWNDVDILADEDCDTPFAQDFIFTTVTAVCEFVIPLFLIVTINAIIYYEIRKRRKILPNSKIQSSHIKVASINPTPQEDRISLPDFRRRDLKAAKYHAVLVIMFLVTWTPYTFLTIVISFCEDCVNGHVYEIFTWLIWSKCAINPFLYAFNSQRFRFGYKRIIISLFICKKERAGENSK
ncbi:hypothetical protein KUTeg_024565 [Tegillarca granosa]|uniref:G-protein coupled receptors family 1 profile domain-containing protein n=1 Tax=Tegillarca granosa TaxID=220873 RepID=A0ABQ9E1P7_TEGGR|nr:hypothetical protein KUTeg_024565 [Tegillarca granosa]